MAVDAPVIVDNTQVQVRVQERAEPLRPVAIDLGNVVGLEFDMCARHCLPSTPCGCIVHIVDPSLRAPYGCALPPRVLLTACKRSIVSAPLRPVSRRVVAGRNLSAKDGGGLLGGEKTSDPYCVVRFESHAEQSPHVAKTLDPEWNWSCKFEVQGRQFCAAKVPQQSIRICLFDHDSGAFDSECVGVRDRVVVG